MAPPPSAERTGVVARARHHDRTARSSRSGVPIWFVLPNVPTWWGDLTPFAWIALAARAARPVPPDAVRSGRAPTRAPAVRGKRGACGSASPTAARTSSSEKAAVPGEQARGERADRAREQRRCARGAKRHLTEREASRDAGGAETTDRRTQDREYQHHGGGSSRARTEPQCAAAECARNGAGRHAAEHGRRPAPARERPELAEAQPRERKPAAPHPGVAEKGNRRGAGHVPARIAQRGERERGVPALLELAARPVGVDAQQRLGGVAAVFVRSLRQQDGERASEL